MTPDCLIKVKTLLPDSFDNLKVAYDQGDSVKWNTLLDEAAVELTQARRGMVVDMNIDTQISDYLNAQVKAGTSMQRALNNLISGSGTTQKAGITSLDMDIKSLRGYYMAELADIIHDGRPKILGLTRSRNQNIARDFIKSVFKDVDAKTSKELQLWRDSWTQVLKAMRQRFNKAGGDIPEFEKYYIATSHEPNAVRGVTKEQWVQIADKHFYVLGQKGKAEKNKLELLEEAYDNIIGKRTGDITPSDIAQPRAKKLANRHQIARVLQPKTGDDWLAYNAKFGRHANPIDAMIEHINSFATEIAAMEKFGTNPGKKVRDLVATVRQRTGKQTYLHTVQRTYDQIMAENPGGTDFLTDSLQSLMNYQTMTKLPFSALTATSDTIYMTTRALYNGMSPVKIMTRMIKNLNPLDHTDRKAAGELGLLLDYALHRATALNRYNDVQGYGMLHRLTDFSTRISGLNFWTNTAKEVFGLEFLASSAKAAELPFNKINGSLRRAYERYGISADDWTILQQAVVNKNGQEFIDVTQDIVPDSVAKKFLAMVHEETNFAIPEPNAKAHAAAGLWTQKNSVSNKLIKVGMQFKPFSVSVFMNHFGSILDKGMPYPTKAAYTTSLLAGSAVVGTLIIQANEVAKGRTPRELSPELVLDGVLKGGFGGIVADLMMTNPDEFGGLAGWALGPTVGDAIDLQELVYDIVGEQKKSGKGIQRKLVPAAVKGLQENFFPGRNPITRLAMERLLWDNVNKAVDPNYNKKLYNRKKWLKERGQERYNPFE